MDEQIPSTGQTQNVQENVPEKEWYKNGWGIFVAIILFPYFLLWYMWAKTNWNKKVKWVITVIFVIINIASLSGNSSDQPTTTNPPEIKKPAETKTVAPAPTAPQAPQFTFDVPNLIGKNIDEIKSALGDPANFKEPTKEQLAITDEWYMDFNKDSNNLLITYNPKTKMVMDFFIEGTDKNKVLTIGNLKQDNNDYAVRFVNSIKDPNVITGVTISKKLPMELNGNVTYNAVAFKIDNKEIYPWTNCKFEINGKTFSSGYSYKSADGIKANDSLIIPFSEFTKDGTRFNFFEQKPENLSVSCDTIGQHRNNYFMIK